MSQGTRSPHRIWRENDGCRRSEKSPWLGYQLSRGGSRSIKRQNNTVVKTVTRKELETLQRMAAAFVEVLSWRAVGADKCQIEMPLLLEAMSLVDPAPAMLRGVQTLKQHVWSVRNYDPHVGWRSLLRERLLEIRPKSADSVNNLIAGLPEPMTHCCIHGDPTAANLLYDCGRRRWVWCDPLDRPWVPGDPAVDVGKMFQSCWGYEETLLSGAEPMWNGALAHELADTAGVSFEAARSWCYVHIIRLLPYVKGTATERGFNEVLNDVGL